MPEEQSAEDAALESVDQDRLLDGEDPATVYADDAEHWRRVYGELVTFKRELVELTLQRIADVEPDAAAEIARTDLEVLRAEAERLGRRHAYWTRRCAELAGSSSSDSDADARA